MNRIALSLLAAAALVGCEAAPTSPTLAAPGGASRQVIVNDHVEDFVATFASCSGEVIEGTAKIHTVIGITRDAAGGFHVSFHQQFSNLRLVGTVSGVEYSGSQEFHDNFNLKAGEEETSVFTFKAIGRGQTPNEIVHGVFHITINANGEVTSFVNNFSFECH